MIRSTHETMFVQMMFLSVDSMPLTVTVPPTVFSSSRGRRLAIILSKTDFPQPYG